MAKLDAFFGTILDTGASDMHLIVGSPPVLRISGHLTPVEYANLTDEVLRPLLYEILTERQIEEFESSWDIDFAYSAPNIARFRCNIYMTRTGIAGAFRMIPFEMPTLEQIGAPPIFKELCDCKAGLVLVTGPTGSGKSTTMAALVNFINETRAEHIVTLEDPLEFIHEVKGGGVISQREIGTHCKSFSQGLRAALREDPDVVLVGEMRDLETIQLAITAAETGHLVFGTLHTRSAAKTVDRIIDVFPTDRQEQVRAMLSESLQGVISQALLRREGGGRVAAYEILTNASSIPALIREKKTFQIQSVMQTGRKEGMQTMDQHLLKLLEQKLVSQEEALKYADNPSAITKKSAAVPTP